MNKNNLKILDCTLRDGGYLIDWDFKKDNILKIHQCLCNSGIDYIECGFLKEFGADFNKTFYNTAEELLILTRQYQKYTVMINFGEYSITNFNDCLNENIKIRVAFKKEQCKDALNYIRQLKNRGWDVFANPMSTNTYTRYELKSLIDEINKIEPYGLTIVDTLGNMYENEIADIFKFIDENTDKNLALCFHSHNNMQLSFSNAKEILKLDTQREIILDSCLYGMGRGAGNLCTELITKYLNDNFGYKYDIFNLLENIKNVIMPYYYKKPWGYSIPYYMAAIRGCHPNYASYLVNLGFDETKIDELLAKIPEDKKTTYDEIFISSFV